jgi:hypothetical protein
MNAHDYSLHCTAGPDATKYRQQREAAELQAKLQAEREIAAFEEA